MAEDTTESDKSNEPKKAQTRKRTTAAGLVLSGMSTMLDVAAQAAARAESVQKMVDSLMPFEQPTPDGMDLLVGIPAYRKLDAIAAEAAAQNAPDQPASDRGPGEQRKQDPQSVSAGDGPSPVDRLARLEALLAVEAAAGDVPAMRRLALIAIWRGNPDILSLKLAAIVKAVFRHDERAAASEDDIKSDILFLERETGYVMRKRRASPRTK